MTADPIAGIDYPVLTSSADITTTMKPVVDEIGSKFKTGLPRGGQFGPSTFNLSAGVTATLSLARISGDTDMVSGGNIVIPATWGGTWTLSVYWQNTVAAPGVRTFIDVKHLTSGRIWRFPIVSVEDRMSAGITVQLAAGDTIQVQMYCQNALTSNILTLDMWRLS